MFLTFDDLVQHVVQYAGSNPNTQAVQQARKAAIVAYTNLGKHQDWQYYKRTFSVITTPGYSTGTVAFDFTGGAYERVLTLTGGTWPTWAAYGYVNIGGVAYQVSSRKSNTEVQLDVNNNPQADIAAGTSFNLLRDQYILPLDFNKAMSAVTQPGGISLRYASIAQWAYGRDYTLAAGRPLQFTVTGDVNVPQRKIVRFWPGPDTTYSILFTYKADLAVPTYLKVSDGDVTLTNSSAVATGNNTRWVSGMAGAVLRVSQDGVTLPTGIYGDNPASQEYLIDSVQSPTSLTLSTAAADVALRVKGVVTNLLDVDPLVTAEFLLREAERQYRMAARMTAVNGEMEAWKETLNRARDADAAYAGWQGSSPWRPYLTIFDVGPVPAP